ncbi:MAG: hypothetical protein U1F87_06720 [Kiritimatiellia bacterium]
MNKMISTTEAVRHLGDYLARIRYRGESFVLTKNDEPVATLSPASHLGTATWGDLCDAVAGLPQDPGFADDLERVNRGDRVLAHLRQIDGGGRDDSAK